jgi:hypothetical protein
MGTLDHKTRGRTSPERLRALDGYLVHAEDALLRRDDGAWAQAAFVDVGFGEHPWTTLESARAFRALNPGLRVIGVEQEPHRVEAASEHRDALTDFRAGGFDLPLSPGERVRLIRALNLLRGYPPERVGEVHQKLGGALLDGGLLLEGSTDARGGVGVSHLLRRRGDGVLREALLFHTDFSHGFAPILFRDWLPRDLRRRAVPGQPIHAFLADWTAAWEEARTGRSLAPVDAFREAIPRLARRREGIATDPWLTERGYLVWKPQGGVPEAR